MSSLHVDFPRIQSAPLSLDALLAEGRDDCGALAIFAGTVRDHHQGRSVLRLAYTAHAALGEKMIRGIEAEIREAHNVPLCRAVHRVGELGIGEAAIIAIVRAPHRAEAFAALRALVDAVKHRVPIWKEEFYADGTRAFVQGCYIAGAAAPAHHHHAHEHGEPEHA